MKIIKSIICFVIVAILLAYICSACNNFAPYNDGLLHSENQLTSLLNWLPILLIIAFCTGFMPAFIHETLKEMKGQAMPQPEPQPEQEIEQPSIYVGQVLTFEDCKCKFTVKTLKVPIQNINYPFTITIN